MNIISLPNIIHGKESSLQKSPFFYYHIGHKEFFKSRISFRQHCIAFLLTGKKRILHQDKELIYDNTSCLLFRSGNYVSNEIATDGTPYHSILMFFDDVTLREFSFKYKHDPKVRNAKSTWTGIAIPTTPYIQSFLDSLKQLFHSKAFSDNMSQIKFDEIMLHFLERYGMSFLDFFICENAPTKYELFRKIVESHIEKDTSIEELAFLCNMSISTFKRHFTRVYASSPGFWLSERRLDHAAYLLKVRGKLASEIFEEIGYSSLSSFMHSFKKRFGVTPRSYQQRN